jgi:nucleotide-binding universal stress UspA family protein
MIRAQEVYEELVRKAQIFANNIKERAISAGIKADAIVKDGEVFKIIIDTAKEHQADMIVMGSTAERVLGHASFPVLIVKP